MSEIDELEDGPEIPMARDDERLADTIYAAVMAHSRHSGRGQQSAAFRVGISDLGYCGERTRRMLGQEVPDDTDVLAAFIGTAIGADVEEALVELWPDAISQAEVELPLAGDVRTFNVMGHPDLIRPDWGVLDVKTGRGLNLPRRVGPSQQQQFQRHCYTKAASLAGLLTIPLEEATVGNVWFDRAADEKTCYVQSEPYNEEVVAAATEWLDDVVYSYLMGIEARKEPPRNVCEATCGFFATCRALDTDVEGLIYDDVSLTAIAMYQEGALLEKSGKQMKDQAKKALTGVFGSTGEFAVRWVHVDGGHVSYDRRPSDRLTISKLK